MSDTRFQITTFDKRSTMFSRVADRSIHAGITEADLPKLLDVEPESTELRVALEMTTQEGRKYTFKNRRGEVCQLELASR